MQSSSLFMTRLFIPRYLFLILLKFATLVNGLQAQTLPEVLQEYKPDLRIEADSTGALRLKFNRTAGFLHEVQRTYDLAQWETVQAFSGWCVQDGKADFLIRNAPPPQGQPPPPELTEPTHSFLVYLYGDPATNERTAFVTSYGRIQMQGSWYYRPFTFTVEDLPEPNSNNLVLGFGARITAGTSSPYIIHLTMFDHGELHSPQWYVPTPAGELSAEQLVVKNRFLNALPAITAHMTQPPPVPEYPPAVATVPGNTVHYRLVTTAVDTDGDSLTDAEEMGQYAGYGLDPTQRDSDGDGRTDAESAGKGTEVDSDNDGVMDSYDAVPLDPLIRWPRAALPHYAVIPITVPEGATLVGVNGDGRVLFKKAAGFDEEKALFEGYLYPDTLSGGNLLPVGGTTPVKSLDWIGPNAEGRMLTVEAASGMLNGYNIEQAYDDDGFATVNDYTSTHRVETSDKIYRPVVRNADSSVAFHYPVPQSVSDLDDQIPAGSPAVPPAARIPGVHEYTLNNNTIQYVPGIDDLGPFLSVTWLDWDVPFAPRSPAVLAGARLTDYSCTVLDTSLDRALVVRAIDGTFTAGPPLWYLNYIQVVTDSYNTFLWRSTGAATSPGVCVPGVSHLTAGLAENHRVWAGGLTMPDPLNTTTRLVLSQGLPSAGEPDALAVDTSPTDVRVRTGRVSGAGATFTTALNWTTGPVPDDLVAMPKEPTSPKGYYQGTVLRDGGKIWLRLPGASEWSNTVLRDSKVLGQAGAEVTLDSLNTQGVGVETVQKQPEDNYTTLDERYLWLNGRLEPLTAFFKADDPATPAVEEAAADTSCQLMMAPDNSVMVVKTVYPKSGANQKTRFSLLLPAGFVTEDTASRVSPVQTLLTHSQPPKVTLDPVSNSSVAVNGTEATITLSGDIVDSIMGAVPQGKGADIQQVTAFVNDGETDVVAALTRSSKPPRLFSPYSDTARFEGLAVKIQASGVQRVRVETAPNAAGMKGSAEVEVVFSRTWSVPAPLPAITEVYDLLLPAAITANAVETIGIATNGAQPFAQLVETAASSRTFTDQTTGITLWLNADFQPTSTQADPLACTLHVPASLIRRGGSAGEIVVTCAETGLQTLRFRHTASVAASASGAVSTDSLRSVKLLDSGPRSASSPVAFVSDREDLTLEFLGSDFAVEAVPGESRSFATTAAGKPLIGFLVRKEDTVTETESLEFIYYDHASAALVRIGRAASVTKEEWRVETSAGAAAPQELPLKRVSMLNADGSAGEGFVPVEIDTLISLVEGNTYIELQQDNQFLYEVTGVKPGEVLRVVSQEVPSDRFDLIVPGATPRLTPHTRKADLVQHTPGVYRTQQKVVVYSTGPDGPQKLTDSQWLALKALGYLAVHNGAPVVRCAADIDQFLAAEGITDLHPPSDMVFGDGVAPPKQSAAYRHKGFTDHHVINVYHDNDVKRKKWLGMLKSMFGDEFHPDEFTIPVHDKLHKKAQHLSTQVWDELLEGPNRITTLFDNDGKPLPGVTSQQIADMRYRTFTAMDDSINAMSGTTLKVDRGRMRIWPAVVDKANHPLKKQFLDGGWRMGTSAARIIELDRIVAAGLTDTSKLARLKAMRKTLVKSIFKGGVKAIAISVACGLLKGYAVAEVAYGTLTVGWQETLAQKLNDDLGLEDIVLARQIVSNAFTTDIIPGGTRVVQHELPNGNRIGEGDLTFKCYWDSDRIYALENLVVTEMKTFPEGNFKMALVPLKPPHTPMIVEDPPWFIRGWHPHVGASASDYWKAVSKAQQNQQ